MLAGQPGKLRKYLLYAIGEILLVMLGILLALQVNNWNDARKQANKEKEILHQFKNELNEDLLILRDITNANNFVIKSCNVLVEHLEKDLPYHDSLSIYFDRWASPNVLEFNTSTFNPDYALDNLLRNEITAK